MEFDDGDTGRIPLSHIRLLPPDYKIQCELDFLALFARMACGVAFWGRLIFNLGLMCFESRLWGASQSEMQLCAKDLCCLFPGAEPSPALLVPSTKRRSRKTSKDTGEVKEGNGIGSEEPATKGKGRGRKPSTKQKAGITCRLFFGFVPQMAI